MPQDLCVHQGVVYADPSGRRLALDLFARANDDGARELVVHIHGGAWRVGRRSAGGGIGELAALVREGYAVASIDYRTSPPDRYPAFVNDLREALGFLTSDPDRFGLRPGPIGLVGTSAGAQIALAYSLGPENLRRAGWSIGAVVDFYGPVDLAAMLAGPQHRMIRRAFGARSVDDPVLAGASPISLVRPDAPPILVIHGTDDAIVPFDHSRSLIDRYRAAGAPAELVAVAGAGHALRPTAANPNPSRAEIRAAVVDFLGRYLRS